ncbi:MAG: DUF4331 domain-containing protein [Planctomycetes bacterium]|nr:DUF4331 domain-containing protein [Planctomycetota bacterium]
MHTTKFTGLIVTLATLAAPAMASSHMDAPLITLDDAANTTDVYAFVGKDPAGQKALQMAVSVYPFEDPGIGPNKYDFDDRVLYALHVATGKDVARGVPTISYFFEFQTSYKTKGTILQSYLGVIKDVDDANQNRTQRYAVTRVSSSGVVRLGSGVVPPNNQGIATPEYNTARGEGLAKIGVDSATKLDKYTSQTVASLATGHYSWCGQREDGFYGDIQAVFDLLQLRGKGAARDSQRGFNVHTINLSVPMAQLGGDMQQVGVWATTYRKTFTVRIKSLGDIEVGDWVQIGRQGNPLFCEAFVAIADKDLYNRCPPSDDPLVFKKYADSPELAKLLNAIVFKGNPIPGIETNRSDLVGIFIPDLIKVDLSTNPVPLAGGGPNHVTTPDDPGYSRLSIFGGDTSYSALAQGQVPSGWPNGRRFGDDVIDIGVSAVISDLRTSPPVIRLAGDNVDANDAVYNKVFPYGGVPHNGRNHRHD